MDELNLHKKFLLQEKISDDPEVLLQSIVDVVGSLSPSSQKDLRRQQYALSQLNKLKFKIKKLKQFSEG